MDLDRVGPVGNSTGVTDDGMLWFTNQWYIALLCFVLFRYTRLVVSGIAYLRVPIAHISAKPAYSTGSDVTVIIPSTLSDWPNLVTCISSIIANCPFQVILVVADTKLLEARRICDENSFDQIVILGVPKMGKRLQLIKGLKRVVTPLVVFADDDVIWPSSKYLAQLLSAFEDPCVGAAGTNQRVIRDNEPNLWNFLGTCYLERRNFNTFSTNLIDGGISTLSGRTAAYRTSILQNKDFYHAFRNDSFLGHILNSDDDKMLTRWTYSHGWEIKLLFLETNVLYTTLESGNKFLSQCVRWARAHWRGNLRVVLNENYWWKKHVWTLYAVYIGSLQTPAILVDACLLYITSKTLDTCRAEGHLYLAAWIGILFWILITKIVKIIPHFTRYPDDLRYIPAAVAFSYLHGVINVYALMTLHVTRWGSRLLEAGPAEDEADEDSPLIAVDSEFSPCC